jgi:hypothetical protein
MLKQPLVVAFCLLGAALIALGVKLTETDSRVCDKMEAKLELAKEFCDGLALRAANERCAQVAEDQEVMGQCMRVIVPAAHSSCMNYLNLERLKQQHASLCEQ